MIIVSFGACLLLFVAIGLFSATKSEKTSDDYLLAGCTIKPWLAALSAVATNNSGYMFVGMIGYTYAMGLSSSWLMFGWLTGDYCASVLTARPLREATERRKALSFVEILARWHGHEYKTLRIIGAVITIIFLCTYAAAQLNAGSKALHVLFGWNYAAGAIIGSIMVLLYCWAGGIRASIWTDAAQSIVMIFAMGLLLFTAISTAGGIEIFWEKLDNISPHYLDWFPADLPLGAAGPFLFVLGWLGGGFGVAGQPHIMVRYMTVSDSSQFKQVRYYYYAWFAAFYAMTIGAGLAARLLLPETTSFDAELALPTLAQQLLPDILVGLILAGLFAATMSTADSQILVCSASITRDLFPNKKCSYAITKMATLCVTILALGIALAGNESVFQLVLVAWALLASAFAPLLTIYALGGKPSERLAVAIMAIGIGAMLLWRQWGVDSIIYEVVPGMAAGFIVYGLACAKEKLQMR